MITTKNIHYIYNIKIKKWRVNMNNRNFNDEINETRVVFHSNASQSLINSLSFNGEWVIVKQILLDWGYSVIEPKNVCVN